MKISVATGYAHLAQRQFARYLKAALRFPVEIQGKKYLKHLVNASNCSLRIDECAGWTRFDVREYPELKDEYIKIRKLAEKWLSEAESRRSDGFPINLMLSSDLLEHPDILKFALHNEFFIPASIYLGQVPRLTELALWWSPKNENISGSQKFHYDHRDTRQMKIFLNLNNICEDSGPLCFLPADVSSWFNSKIGYNQIKNEDDVVYSVCTRDALIKNTGEAGTGIMVDTSRCLHYGSRQNKKDRLILMISYVRPNCIKAKKSSRALNSLRYELAEKLFANDPVRKYALTVQAI